MPVESCWLCKFVCIYSYKTCSLSIELLNLKLYSTYLNIILQLDLPLSHNKGDMEITLSFGQIKVKWMPFLGILGISVMDTKSSSFIASVLLAAVFCEMLLCFDLGICFILTKNMLMNVFKLIVILPAWLHNSLTTIT